MRFEITVISLLGNEFGYICEKQGNPGKSGFQKQLIFGVRTASAT
jgi:hypothetical protein